MKLRSPIYTEETECQDCYKCIRQCPVKAIRVENGHAQIISDICIMCGRCVTNCPSKAKHVRDDLSTAKQLFQLKEKIIVSLAPSFISEFPEYSPAQLVVALKKLGFYGVSETAIGADIVSAQIAEDMAHTIHLLNDETDAHKKDTMQKLFLSSACPTAVEYIKRFMSEYAPYITDRASPLLAHARFLKAHYGESIGVVFIGPCIAKKREADAWKSIDAAISFKDLKAWFTSESIHPEMLNAETATADAQGNNTPFIPLRSAKGALYPIDGGMIASIKKYGELQQLHAMSITGIDSITAALQGLKNNDLHEPLFIELLACDGGCINGPMTVNGRSTALKRMQILEYTKNKANTLSVERPKMTDTIPITDVRLFSHSEEEIRTALRSVGKYVPKDEVNCASCGYDTCREFVSAMLDNRAEKTMCVSYMRKLAQKKANGLVQAIPSGVIVADKNLQIIECNFNFAKLMGEDIIDMYDAKPGLEGADLTRIVSFSRFFADVMAPDGPDLIEREVREGKRIFQVTVFAIEKEECAGGVIEDVTAPQIRKNRIVSQAHKVINKNLAVVQKIAFLLGENAAETESMLNSIIDSFSTEDDEDTDKGRHDR